MVTAEYHPPAPELIYTAGCDMQSALLVGGWMFKEGNYISEHDYHILAKLAYVMCGGGLTRPNWVSEQYLLDLEREAFLSLCGEKKTQERMWSILQSGKMLRN
jgi:3-hydroxyacyl-CoA dehydrogenase